MCDQTVVQYRPNDIVWVKLSTLWWPGEVVDKDSVECDFITALKKPPLALVKFFNEDTYEFPRDYEKICHYNCSKKDEFIKKGRNGVKKDEKRREQFVADVQTAERKTGGDPEYVFHPKFNEEEKYDYRQDFGLKPLNKGRSSKSKEINRRSMSTPRAGTSASPRIAFSSPRKPVSKSKVVCSPILNKKVVRHSKKRNIPKIMVLKPKKKGAKPFDCMLCSYTTKRINNIIWHLKGHYLGVNLPPPPSDSKPYLPVFGNVDCTPSPGETRKTVKRKSSPDKIASIKRKKIAELKSNEQSKIEEITAGEKASTDSSQSKKKLKKQKPVKEPKSSLVALDILKDWDDDSNGDLEAKDDSVSVTEDKQQQSQHKNELLAKPTASDPIPDSTTKTPEKSCFDFEDNEDVINLDHSLKFGQKLPRVINDKSPTNSKLKRPDNTGENLLKDVDSFLEATKIPELPEIPKLHALSKSEKAVEPSQFSVDIKITQNNKDSFNKDEDNLKFNVQSCDLSVDEKAEENLNPDIVPALSGGNSSIEVVTDNELSSNKGKSEESIAHNADVYESVIQIPITADVSNLPCDDFKSNEPHCTALSFVESADSIKDLNVSAINIETEITESVSSNNQYTIQSDKNSSDEQTNKHFPLKSTLSNSPDLTVSTCSKVEDMTDISTNNSLKVMTDNLSNTNIKSNLTDSRPNIKIDNDKIDFPETSGDVAEVPIEELSFSNSEKIEEVIKDKIEETENSAIEASLCDFEDTNNSQKTVFEEKAFPGDSEKLGLDSTFTGHSNQIDEPYDPEIPCHSKQDKPFDSCSTPEPYDSSVEQVPFDSSAAQVSFDSSPAEEPHDSHPIQPSCGSSPEEKLCDSTPEKKPYDSSSEEKLCDSMPTIKPYDSSSEEKLCDSTPTEKPYDSSSEGKLCDSIPDKKPYDSSSEEKLCDSTPEKKSYDSSSEELSKPDEEPCYFHSEQEPENSSQERQLSCDSKPVHDPSDSLLDRESLNNIICVDKTNLKPQEIHESVSNCTSSVSSQLQGMLMDNSDDVSVLKLDDESKSVQLSQIVDSEISEIKVEKTSQKRRFESSKENSAEGKPPCKKQAEVDKKEIISHGIQETISDESRVYEIITSDVIIDIADIPLPAEIVPESSNLLDISTRKIDNIDNKEIGGRESDEGQSNNEIISKSSENLDIKPLLTLPEKSEQPLLDINSMPVVIGDDNMPLWDLALNQNTDPPKRKYQPFYNVYFTKRGRESKIKPPPGMVVDTCFQLPPPPPDFKPCEALRRIQLPLQKKFIKPKSKKRSDDQSTFIAPSSLNSNSVVEPTFAVPSTSFVTSGKNSGSKSASIVKRSEVRVVKSSSGQKVYLLPKSESTVSKPSGQGGSVPAKVSTSSTRIIKHSGNDQEKSDKRISIISEKVPSKVPSRASSSTTTRIPKLSANKQDTPDRPITIISEQAPMKAPLMHKQVPVSNKVYSQLKRNPNASTGNFVHPSTPRNIILNKSNKQSRSTQHNSKVIKPPPSPNPVSSPKTNRSSPIINSNQKVPTNIPENSKEKKGIFHKVKQSTPNILQRSPRKHPPKCSVNKTVSNPPKSTNKTNSSIVSTAETSNNPNQPILFLTLESDGSSNQLVPFECTAANASTSAIINVTSAPTSDIIFSLDSSNFINVGSSNNSGQSTKPISQDILAEAVANTEGLLSESSDLNEAGRCDFSKPSLLQNPMSATDSSAHSPQLCPTNIKLNKNHPSLPLMTADSINSPASSSLTYQIVSDNEIILASSENPDANITSKIVPQQANVKIDKCQPNIKKRKFLEENVLPEFLKGDLIKKSIKMKRK